MSRTFRDSYVFKEEGFKNHRSKRHTMRDKKPWFKPSKRFKKIFRSMERARWKNALRQGKETLPIFKRNDVYEWN